MNTFLAGLISAVPLSILGLLYMLVGGRSLVATLQAASQDAEPMTDQQWFWLMLVGMALAPFLFGLLSALVYRWVSRPQLFSGLALGLAVVFSVLAVATRTPAAGQKVIMNFLVALNFGLLLPWISR